LPFTSALAFDLAPLIDASWTATTVLTRPARLARTALGAEVLTGAQAVAHTAHAWRCIEAAGGVATPFQTQAFAHRLAETHLRRGETPRVIVVHESGKPVVILPTVVTRWNGLATIRFLGDPLIQYGDAVVAPGASSASIEAAWRAAADPAVASLVYLRKVRDDAKLATLLTKKAKAAAVHEAPFVDVAQASSMNARDARELRRLRRRLDELGGVTFEVLQGPEAAFAVAETLALKRAWIGGHGLPSSVIGNRDWESAICDVTGAASSPLRVARLLVGGRTAAAEIAFVHDGRWCAFVGAIAPDFARSGPGHVQMAETIAHCRGAGISLYDLLAPTEAYKSRIAHGAVEVRDYVAPLTTAGWAGVAAARSIPAIKAVAARTPPGLRRLLVATQRHLAGRSS
jgi:CelD/BcsL family acetyltransferase involved in cellulose biosynthesis